MNENPEFLTAASEAGPLCLICAACGLCGPTHMLAQALHGLEIFWEE
jgi:hypothetical protein